MIRSAVIILCILLVFPGISQDKGILFQSLTWQETLDEAREKKQLVFICACVNWSQYCEDLHHYVFVDPEVGTFYNKNFVNVELDMDDYPGAEIGDWYEVTAYPTYLFINGEGELVHKACGAMDTQEMLDMGALALDDEANLQAWNMEYRLGNRDPEFLAGYSLMLDYACIEKGDFINHFFGDLTRDEWTGESAWIMINLNVTDPYSEQFQFLLQNKDQFARKYGKDTVDQKIFQVLYDQFAAIYNETDLTLFSLNALNKLVNQLDFNQKAELQTMINVHHAELTESWEKYGENVVRVVEEQEITDEDQLNEFSWKFYVYVSDTSQLQTALGWMEKIVGDQQEATFLDTYASLLFKLGRVKEAIRWEKKALQAAQRAEEEIVHYQLQLERFMQNSGQ